MPSCSPIVQTLHLSLSSSTHALFQSIPSLFPLQAPWLHDIIFRALTENSPGGTLCISAQVSFKANLQTIHKNKCFAVSESVWAGSCSLTEGEGKWLKVDASRAHLYSWKQEDFADVFFKEWNKSVEISFYRVVVWLWMHTSSWALISM